MPTATSPPYLLLHGTPLTPEIWGPLAAELAPEGTALSPWVVPRPDASEVVPELAYRIAQQVPAGWGPAHVVGHSFGGQVAIELGLRHPELVGRLTLICTRDTPFPPFTRAAADLRAGEAIDPEATLGRWFRPQELARPDPVVSYARRCVTDADPALWATALDAIAGFDSVVRTPGLALPVHLVAAEHDQVSTVAAMSEMADRLPDARLTVLTGAAHLSPFLRPGDLARLISGS